MSLYASLFSGVSGLSANSSAMGMISDNIVNINFRDNPDVTKVHMDIIEEVVNDFVLPIVLNLEDGKLEFAKQNFCCEKGTCRSD